MTVDDSEAPEIPMDRPMTRGEARAIAVYLRGRALLDDDRIAVSQADILIAKLDRAERVDPRRC